MEKIEFLKRLYSQITEVPPEQLDAVDQITELRTFSRNEYFVQSGDRSDLIGIVMEGLFRGYYIAAHKYPVII